MENEFRSYGNIQQRIMFQPLFKNLKWENHLDECVIFNSKEIAFHWNSAYEFPMKCARIMKCISQPEGNPALAHCFFDCISLCIQKNIQQYTRSKCTLLEQQFICWLQIDAMHFVAFIFLLYIFSCIMSYYVTGIDWRREDNPMGELCHIFMSCCGHNFSVQTW